MNTSRTLPVGLLPGFGPYSHRLTPFAESHDLAAEQYDRMAHNPTHRDVASAYRTFAVETIRQWHDMIDRGLRVDFFDGAPKYANSAEMFADLAAGHLWTLLTDPDDGFASLDHPMLELVDVGVNLFDGRLYLNDIFRAVHDVYGHGVSGGSFALTGEYRAWLAHRTHYSADALAALWNETRGQAAWTNVFADHSSLPLAQRPFAIQKVGIVPVAFR